MNRQLSEQACNAIIKGDEFSVDNLDACHRLAPVGQE